MTCKHNFKPLGGQYGKDDYEKCTKCGLISTRNMARNAFRGLKSIFKVETKQNKQKIRPA